MHRNCKETLERSCELFARSCKSATASKMLLAEVAASALSLGCAAPCYRMMISGPCGTDAFPRPIGVGALPLNRFEPAWGELAILELLPCNSPCFGRSAALIG